MPVQATVTQPRPYFLPQSIDYEALPLAVRAAFDTIISPAYDELVMSPASGLERAAGATIVFLLVEELLDQFELGQTFNLAQTTDGGDRQERNRALNRHLQLVSSKQTAVNALLRVKKMSMQPQVINMGPPVVSG
ncbi:MAG: hypothetical protein ACXW4Z_10445 [Candidatus Binatia bacterium]